MNIIRWSVVKIGKKDSSIEKLCLFRNKSNSLASDLGIATMWRKNWFLLHFGETLNENKYIYKVLKIITHHDTKVIITEGSDN